MNRRGALGRMLTIPVAAASRATAAAPVPLSARKKRIFYNDDGDTGLQSYRGPLRPEIATDCVNMLLGTVVTSLVLCVSYSDWAIFPSKVVSMLDWRETPSSRRSPYWRHVYQFYREVREKGWDIPKLALAHAAEKGLEFIPSMRMNDTHFAIKVHPDVNPLTSKFWMEHRDLAIDPDLKWSPSNFTEYAVDFRHEVVRRRRLSHAFRNY